MPQEYAIYWRKDVYFDQYFRTGGSKRINYSNPEFDKLIDEEQRTGDHKKRIAILHQAGRILMEDVPFAPLYTLAELYGWRETLSGRAHRTVRFLPRK